MNKTLRTLDISNNGLYFREEEGLRGSLEKLVCNSNLTSIVIGGNMDIDDELMQKLGEWIAASGRRWRNVSVGSVDSDFDDAVTRLKAGVRAATAAVESKAIAGYFSRPRTVEAPAKASAEPDVPRHQIGRAVSPVRGDHDDNVRQRDRSQSPGPVDDEKTVNSEVVPTETVASGAVLPSETPTAASSMPPGASPTRWVAAILPLLKLAEMLCALYNNDRIDSHRCQLFLEAFHAIRGDDESINKQVALEQIASERPDENFGVAEMECYLQFMMDNNFIMLSAAEDTIYIV